MSITNVLSNQCEFLTILSKTMKQINYLAALAVTLLIGMLTSCAPKDDGPEEATLSLSATSVTIPNAGGEAQAITVTTNQVKWNAISNADWIKTTVSGNSLQIVAMPNEAGKDRAAQVLVVAGSTSEKVEVIQTAADISLEVSPETIVVPNSGASKLISVKSNSGAWTLDIDEAAQAWIKQNVFNDMIELEIAANDGEPREAKLYAKSGTLQKEITVQQAGKGAGFHTPLLTNSYPTQYQLLSYEKEQGSFLMSYSAPSAGLPSWGIPPSGAMYEFVTSCEFLPTLTYIFNYEGSYLETIQYVSTLSFEKFKETGYIEFVEKDLGYTLDKSGEIYKGTKEVTDPKGNVLKYKLLIGEAKGKAAVVFQMPTPPDPEQPKAYPTYGEVPLDNMLVHVATPTKVGWKIDDVKKYEADNNGTLEAEKKDPKDNIKYASFNVKSTLPLMHQYWFVSSEDKGRDSQIGQLDALGQLDADFNRVFWKEETKGSYYLTKEFKELMEKNGYEFVAFQTPYHWFQKDDRVVGVSVQNYKDFNDGKDVIRVQAYVDAEASSMEKYLLHKDRSAMIYRHFVERPM